MKKHTTRLDIFISNSMKLFYCYFLAMVLMVIYRTCFVLYFAPVGTINSHLFDIVHAYFLGFRFDTMVINHLLIIPFVLGVISSLLKNKTFYNFSSFISRWIIEIGIIAIVAFLISDFGFFSYFQDHINIKFFEIWEDETVSVFKSMWKNYPMVKISAVMISLILLIHIVMKKVFLRKVKLNFNKGIIKYLLSISIVTFVLGIGARGSFGILPFSIEQSEISENEFVNHIAMNGILTSYRALKLRDKRDNINYKLWDQLGYRGNIQQAFTDYLGFETRGTKKNGLTQLMYRQTMESSFLENNPPNVVLIVLESFGQFWNSYNSKDFNLLAGLEKHFNEDLLFKNFLSSDSSSIGSLLSIGLSMPMRNGSDYMSENELSEASLESSIAKPYNDKNYETSFLYGRKESWRNIGDYLKVQGFKNILDQNSLKKNSDADLGVHDEYLYEFIEEKLKGSKKPQMMIALSTTNQPPFHVPNSYSAESLVVPSELDKRIMRNKNLFQKRFVAYQYANKSVSDFLNNIKNSDLGKNTIVAITGNHNIFDFLTFNDQELFQKFRVPFYLYIPEKYKLTELNNNKFGSHEDIAPTLINLSLSKSRYLTFGRNLLGADRTFSINSRIAANSDGVIEKDYYYQWANSFPKIRSKKVRQNIPKLKTYRNAILSITDFYIKEKLKEIKKKN